MRRRVENTKKVRKRWEEEEERKGEEEEGERLP